LCGLRGFTARCTVFTWGTRFARGTFARRLLIVRSLDVGLWVAFVRVGGGGRITFFARCTFGAFATVTAVAVA
jgi:hypothetical protein